MAEFIWLTQAIMFYAAPMRRPPTQPLRIHGEEMSNDPTITIGGRARGPVSRVNLSAGITFDILANPIHNRSVRESFRGNEGNRQDVGSSLEPRREGSGVKAFDPGGSSGHRSSADGLRRRKGRP
jgi:hypothetical protein